MAPRPRPSLLETPTSRLRLKVRRLPYYVSVAPGISLGYRRNLGPGSWLVRGADGKGGAWTKGFAIADDFEDVDGGLDYWTAQTRARELVRGKYADASKPVTVKEALADYERDLGLRGGLPAKVKRLLRTLPASLLQRPVGLLTARELRKWRDEQRATGIVPATVSRMATVLKAALTHAAEHDPSIANKQAWAVGLKALPDSHRARTNAVLSDDEVRAVVNVCWAYAPWLGLFVEVLAVTGTRPVQAARLLVRDLLPDRLMMPRSAKGRGVKKIDRRPLPIPASLMVKLQAAAKGRPGGDPLLRRSDGNAWSTKRSDYTIPFAKALKAAGLPRVVPYVLRHSSITRALQRGVPAQIVADAHDTSVAMLARNYAAFIADHSAEMLRAAQIDLSPSDAENVVPLAGRR
jgi:integrase